MDGSIELTTAPARFPRRLKRKAWVLSILMALAVCTQFAFTMSTFHITWRDILHRLVGIPAHILSGDDVEGFMVLVIMPILGWLAAQSQRLQFRITPQYLECSNRLPAWAKFVQPDWRIARNQLISVHADLIGATTIARAARVRFVTKNERHDIPLLGWFRIGQDVETQKIEIRKGFLKTDFKNQVQALPIITALKQAGVDLSLEPRVTQDPLRKTPFGWALAIGCIGAMAYALIEVSNQHDRYATQPPWVFIIGVGCVAAYLAWEIVRRSSITREEKLMGIVAAAAMFGLAAWAGAPRLNAMTSAGPQEIVYRYAGNGIFEPEQVDAPTLDLSRNIVSLNRWKAGDQVILHLRRGALGFWQYDRDLAISALDAKVQPSKAE